MTPPAIGANIHQALDVHALKPPQIPLNLVVAFNGVPKLSHIGIREIFDAYIRINPGFSQDFLRTGQTNAVNVGQANFNSFVAWQVHACYPCHLNYLPQY
jgi:hypothetical protein